MTALIAAIGFVHRKTLRPSRKNLNLIRDNGSIQQFNNDNWNSKRRQAPNKGVQIQKAY